MAIHYLACDGKVKLLTLTINRILGVKTMKTQIVGFILFLFLCVLVPLGETTPAPYTISYSGPSHIPPGGSGTFTFTVKKDGIPQSGVTMYNYRRPETKSSLSNETPVTDANGEAQMTLTLESTASGTYRISASAPDREGGKEFDEDVDYVRFNVIVGDSPSASQSTTNTGPVPPESNPTVFFRILGDNQSGVVGEPLAKPFVVGTRDRGGDPLEGIAVTFRVLTGGGSLSATTSTSNANGRTESTLTLGSEPGTNTVEVTAGGTERVLIFKADATLPPVPTTLSIISGNNQSGVTGEALANPFVVEVRDQNSDLMEGVTVTFAVSAGGGSLSDTSVKTDTNGLAQSTLNLGSSAGTNTVEASVEGLSQTVVFNAEATLPPPMATSLEVISGDDQTGLPGETLTNPFVVEVRNQYGDPMAGVTATFTVTAGDGTLSTITAMTDANGQAEITLTLGSDPGTNTVDFSVEGIAEIVTVNAVAKLLEFDLFLPSGISMIHVPLRVRTVDGMAGAIESVADLYDALGGVDTVNWLITYNSESQDWDSYFGDSDRGMVADRILTDHTGILASIKTSVSVRLGGDALGVDGSSTITLNAGLNLVGLPLKDSSITRVSNLFALEGIADNVPVIIVSDNGEFKAVGRAGDPSDIEITGGQSFILTVQQAGTATISGDGWDNTALNKSPRW